MGEGACPSLSNRLEWSCPLFLLLSRTVHLLAAPCDPQPWLGTAGLFGVGDSDGPSCCLSAALACLIASTPSSRSSPVAHQNCCSPFLRHNFTTSAKKPLHVGALDPSFTSVFFEPESFLSFFFFFFAMLDSMQDLSFLTRDGTCASCSGSADS